MMQISNYSMAIQKLIAGVCSLMLIACTQSDPAPATSGITTTPNEISTAQLEMIGGSEVSTGCGSEIESALFADADKLKKLARTNAGFGMRSTASAAHNNAIDWAESNLKRMRGFNIQSDSYTIDRWEPTPRASGQPGRDLVKAGSLQVRNASGAAQTLSVAGAVPYSLPNEGKGQTAPLVYIPGDTAITAANSKGKVVVRDVGWVINPLGCSVGGWPVFVPARVVVVLSSPHAVTPNNTKVKRRVRSFFMVSSPWLVLGARSSADHQRVFLSQECLRDCRQIQLHLSKCNHQFSHAVKVGFIHSTYAPVQQVVRASNVVGSWNFAGLIEILSLSGPHWVFTVFAHIVWAHWF
jgi:hypothetical protein